MVASAKAIEILLSAVAKTIISKAADVVAPTDVVRKNVTIDWTVKQSARAKIRVVVKRILRKHGYPPDLQEAATETVLKQAELLTAECRGWGSARAIAGVRDRSRKVHMPALGLRHDP